jgi:FkbM family methyltransferase
MKKKVRNFLPRGLVQEVRRIRYHWLIRRGQFVSTEYEFERLGGLIKAGETVIDIGANVGHYTLLLSRCVADEGLVIAFEPIGSTFDLLASNITKANAKNVTLINAAVGKKADLIHFTIPDGNPYLAHESDDGEIASLSVRLADILPADRLVSLIKIDAEGADAEIARSISDLVAKARPYIMIELTGVDAERVANWYKDYAVWQLPGSHNSILYPLELNQRVCAVLSDD